MPETTKKTLSAADFPPFSEEAAERSLRRLQALIAHARESKRRAAAGGRAAARKRHTEHVDTKVKPYRDDYRKRLQAGEKSPDIIADMAKKYGYSVIRMRRIIQPRRLRNENRPGR
jgi:hypothetical protein